MTRLLLFPLRPWLREFREFRAANPSLFVGELAALEIAGAFDDEEAGL